MKKAVSLIELLLAIVIVGIGVAALPYIAVSSSKGNAQTLLSEIITSSKIYLDDILLQPWNSALSTGYTTNEGTKMYSGILQTADTSDPRFMDDKDKIFNRTIARTSEDGKIIAKAQGISTENCDGFNCAQRPSKIENKDDIKNTKNIFAFNISAKTNFMNIEEKTAGKTIIATFNPTNIATDTTNAMMIEINATAPNEAGELSGNLLDDVSNITLRSFSFNIGSEPR